MLPGGMTPAEAEQVNRACNTLVRSMFPFATQLELYGAQIHLDANTLQPIAVTCGGVTKEI